MSSTESPALDGLPQFNHFAVTLPSSMLDERHRADILAFLGHVFGWTERSAFTEDQKLIMIQAGELTQFLVLFGSDELRADPMADHLGMKVQSLEQVHAYRERALEFAAKDDRVEVTDMRSDYFDDVRPLNLHSFYVRYIMPIKFEVQYYEYLDAPQQGM